MKKYIYSTIVALVAAAGFTACSDDDVKYDGPGKWDASSDYANVYFKTTSATQAIDPSDPTEYTFQVYRRVEHEYTWGKDSEGNDSITSDKILTPLPALTVKPTILQNTDDVFTVSDATFAEGDTVATITTTFPNAGIGDAYTLKVTFEGSDLVSSYSKNVVYTYTVTREKWVSIGMGTYYDYVIQEMWLGGDGTPYPVEIYQKESDHNQYRIMHPYKDMVTGDNLTAPQSEYMALTILQPGDMVPNATNAGAVKVEGKNLVYYTATHTGFTHRTYGAPVYLLHPWNFSSARAESNWSHNTVLEYQEDGKPGKVQVAAFYYMDGVGGFNYSVYDDLVLITFPGYVSQYEAMIDQDFEWETAFTGEFKSGQLGTSGVAELQRGTCVTTTDDCDQIFAATYGTAYKIVAPYAEGYDLTFCAKGKKVVLPPDNNSEEIYYDVQPIGITAMGRDIYAQINTDESSFTDDLVTLNITFVLLDNRGNVDAELGTATETLANITYSTIATGDYTYTSFFSGEDPGLELQQRDGRDDIYRITHWGYDVDFFFTWDRTTNECSVDEQFTGYTHSSYGDVYVVESTDYNPDWAEGDEPDGTSYFDPETNTFHFWVAYVVSAGYFGHGEETFVANFDEADGSRIVSLTPTVGNFRLNRWNGWLTKGFNNLHKVVSATPTMRAGKLAKSANVPLTRIPLAQ